jgi:dGTPase
MKRNIPVNIFYSDFDCEFLTARHGEDYRTSFERDRDRIIHSSALRRMQAKTQVFFSGEYDFYRTRLTHSIEVAQIGRSICNFLHRHDPLLHEDFYIDPDLVEAICLAHDLGHPPFGHTGEAVLNRLMANYGGFEGNAQTLRILTEIIYTDGGQRTGMKPTRALIDGVMKYKTLRSFFNNPERHFLYDDQKNYLNFVFNGIPYEQYIQPGQALNNFRSIECQIMDWADDTAYSLNDILDSVQARFLNRELLEVWAANQSLTGDEEIYLREILREMTNGNLRRVFSRKIGDFIAASHLKECKNFMSMLTNRYRFQLQVDPAVVAEANFYKRIASDLVFDSPQLQQLRFKWEHLIERLFRALQENYLRQSDEIRKLLPENTHTVVISIADSCQRIRTVCDHVAGMTDRFAIRTYQRMFEPGSGSLGDLL